MPSLSRLLPRTGAALGALLIASAAGAATWTPPTGIPAPSFGATETAGAYTHYVDNTHPSATDSSNPRGTPAKPRRTVPDSLAGGSVVEVRGGPYNISGYLSWDISGTAAQPVFIKGVGSPLFQFNSGTDDLDIDGSYAIIEGLVLDGFTVKLYGHHLVLRSSEIRNHTPGHNGAAVGGEGSNLVVLGNHIHHNRNGERDIHGVKFAEGSSSVWIVDNHIEENGGDEVQLGDDSSGEPWVHHVYVGRNIGHGARENCIDIKQARDIVISENECYDYAPASSSDGTAIVVHNSPERIWIINNTIHDAVHGIRLNDNDGGGTVAVVGNRFYRIHHPPGGYDPTNPWSGGTAIVTWDTPSLEIVNNTFHDVDAGIAYTSGTRPTLRLVNNLFGSLAENTHQIFVSSGAKATAQISHALIQPSARIKWGGTSPVYSLASFKAAYPGQCGGCVEADPRLVAAGSYNLRLASDSPAIDAGTGDPVYAAFASRYGLSISQDSDGNSRPRGAGWDIGAYEYGSAPPFGSFDTPAHGATGLAGGVAVTGWALDDAEVTKVDIWRDPVGGETPAANGKVLLGNATFVRGARPDVESAYPTYPNADRAGWGLMVLTNMLPGAGNGTFTLYAWAHDAEGQATLLASKTVDVDNSASTLPFGALDTPAPGATVSGSAYQVWGWALTPLPGVVPTDGSTIWVYVDGVPLGHPAYDLYRADIATLFPGYANSGGAVGYFVLDTTTLSNGRHAISWSVTDDLGRTQGIGSRYFWVGN